MRKHKDDQQGRLLGTTKGYKRLGGGGNAYQFKPDTNYTGVMPVKKLANAVEISASLSQAGEIISQFSLQDEDSDINHFGMLGFHVNSKTFGSSKQPGEPDNGIDFTHVTLEVLPAL